MISNKKAFVFFVFDFFLKRKRIKIETLMLHYQISCKVVVYSN